ncbi:coiled-coil domain-containing protein 138-like [Ylistrum balloti]|uniref:coiled-coil domain-containing protein 138-like n=1 Tax=Ylistrum balloti TaxID=509963 RepID=UPI0029058470|nr:coiled-coil domain-containing protein 138-like [Ylistrum balloti]
MSNSRRSKQLDFSGDSDLESTVTPINPPDDGGHGQIIESDSLSDFYLHEVKHKKHRKKRQDYDVEVSDEDHQSKNNMKEIYRELQTISKKLKEENKILYEREQKVKERERMVSISSASVQTITDHAIRQRIQAMEEKHRAEVASLEQALREKGKDHKRLKDNFETLKQANDALKKELESLQSEHEKLEKQAMSVQSRLTNLQRKQEFAERQKDLALAVPKQKPQKDVEEKSKSSKQPKVTLPVYTFDVMGVLLDWICDAHLRYTFTDQSSRPADRYFAPEYVQEKVLKILPSSVDLLREFPGQNLRISLPCIQFIYWSLVHIEHGPGSQKSSLSSTLRRLGEEMYRAKTVRFSDTDKMSDSTPSFLNKPDKSKDAVYFRSTNLHVRILSSLIILKTLSQVDLLAHVFDVLRNDLKSDIAKELYLYYHATPVILLYLKPVNKAFMGAAMDIFLQMSSDSPFQQSFLEGCSNETWFRTIAMVLRAPSQDYKVLEKLSVILQKLSKMKSNRKYFEVYTIVAIIQELLRGCATDQAFLALNLKSILFNLTAECSNQI